MDSYIYGNTGNYGGGFYMANAGLITNCIIAGNYAKYNDGGGRLEALPGVGMANCVVSNNTSGGNGGIHISLGAIAVNSIIIGNAGGPAVNVNAGGMMSNCQVIANTGGGVVLYGSAGGASVVANCIIANNFRNASSYAAGIYLENGGLLKNCLIYCNTNLQSYGGVRLYSDTLYTNFPYGLINCTIVDNKSSSGSGIYVSGITNYFANCIVVSNVTSAGAQDNIQNVTAANTNNYWHTCTPDILPPNQGNITSDPLFVNRPDYNYRLSAGSPCINAGTNSAWIINSVDLDRRTRIRYGTVDMGAYEFIRSGTIFGFH